MLKLKFIVPPLLLSLALIFSIQSGQMPISLQELWQALLQNDVQNSADIVLWNIRFPRILTAILVGAALSVAGATYQGMFKNPLVSPDILGVTSGASLGAVFAIYLELPLWNIQIFAFISGLIAVFLVSFLAHMARKQDPILSLVLAGVAISSLLGAGISLLKILSDPYSQLSSVTFWLLGGLNMASFDDLKFVTPLVLIGLLPLILLRWRMNLLSLEDDESQTLGINVFRTRLLFIFSATLMTSAVVSITGIIGWIGLVIPHISRLWVGADFRYLLPTSLFIGSAFLVFTDTIARSLFAIEIPLGVITAFIGAPFFLGLLIRSGQR
ncbi:MAG: iron ABC transporter permease [[Actinobacillus] rossii]|nr:iron ABC transporter permease [[Actinobacillus] rossii]MDY5793654.1 iron ABC transporter permease [[Actinobacillus] rossii]